MFAYRCSPHAETGDTPFFLNKGYDPCLPELRTLQVPLIDEGPDNWHANVSAARHALQQAIANQQEQLDIRAATTTPPFAVGQLVLLKRTVAERQQDHTKLSDKYDHPARISQIFPSQVVLKVILLTTGEEVTVNQRNLRPFYTTTGDDMTPLQGPRLPLATVTTP